MPVNNLHQLDFNLTDILGKRHYFCNLCFENHCKRIDTKEHLYIKPVSH